MPKLDLKPLLALGLLVGASTSTAQNSQISLDGSLPHGRMDVLTGSGTGPDYVISEELGWRSGSNLFHSFGQLGVATGESATFTSDAALPALSHVIARVTGGAPSEINGRLVSQIATADFYLLNPRGVFFGGESSIDVPRSLYVSTAHGLAFANGDDVLDLLHKAAPVLSADPPEAFGFFSGGPRGEVVFSNPLPQSGTRDYAVPAGQTFSAVAGDVRVRNNVVLRAPSGSVQLAAVGASSTEVPLDVAVPLETFGAAEALGEVRVEAGAQILAVNSNRNLSQGSVVIRGGHFVLADRTEDPDSFVGGSVVRAGDFTGADGPSIDVAVSGEVEIRGGGTLVRAEAPGSLPSGGIGIHADTISVSDGAIVQTRADAAQPGGNLLLDARRIRVTSDGILSSVTNRQGAGGHLELRAEQEIEIEGGQVQSFAGAPGAGGDLILDTNLLRVANGRIGSESSATGAGGDIQIDAAAVEIVGGLAQVSTLNRIAAAPEPTIPGGEIRIGSDVEPAGSVLLADGGLISTETSGAQPGGAIRVFADSLEVSGAGIYSDGAPRPSSLQAVTSSASESGAGGSLFLQLGTLRVGASELGGQPGLVAAFVAEDALGPGGSIDLDADSVLLEDGGQISTTTLGDGDAGSIDIDLSGDLMAWGARSDGGLKPSGLFARAEKGSSGDAGDIDVSGRILELLGAAEISSRSDGSGNSGNIDLLATQAIRVVGGFQASSVTARGLDGRAGNITLDAPRVELVDGGIVDVSVSGAGEGGLLRVVGGELLVSGSSGTGIPSSLGAETAGAGDAPGIDIDVSGLVRVERGGELNAISRGEGAAGSIDVTAASIEFVGGRGTGASEAGAAAGSLRLQASGSIRVLDGSELTVRSAQGQDAGTLSLVAPDIVVRDSTLTADADAFGGSIAIETDRLVLEDARLIALSRGEGPLPGALAVSPAADTPAGGNISIDGGAIVLNQASLVADGFGNANGGLIDITADPWLRSGDSVISASSEFGLDGFVIVNTPYGEVTGDLAALPETFLDASSLLEEPCLAREAPSGSFAVQRGATFRPPPDAPLSAGPGEALECSAP